MMFNVIKEKNKRSIFYKRLRIRQNSHVFIQLINTITCTIDCSYQIFLEICFKSIFRSPSSLYVMHILGINLIGHGQDVITGEQRQTFFGTYG